VAKKVRYEASEGQGAVTVSGRRFRPGDVRSVPDALAKELTSGKVEGFKFELVEDKKAESTTDSDT